MTRTPQGDRSFRRNAFYGNKGKARHSKQIMTMVKKQKTLEKRKLLTELENRKQCEFELLYKLEHEKMKFEAKSAYDNVLGTFDGRRQIEELE